MRIKNLKYIWIALFAIIFIVGGFFVSTQKADASNTAQPYSYSLSPVSSYANDVGGVTTVVLVGCFPGSGHKYDINTGMPCTYLTNSPKVGCAIGSGDKYDINTGKICLYVTSNVIIGCASNSGDKYDINTGNLCIVKEGVSQSVTIIPNTKTDTTSPVATQAPGNVVVNNPTLPKDELTKEVPAEKSVDNNLVASAKGIRSIFTWPMSARGITILVVIIFLIAYGIYSLVRKDTSDDMPPFVQTKNKIEVVKPIITSPQSRQNQQVPPVASVQTPKQEEKPTTTTPQATTQNPQMPLNMSNNNPNTGGQPLQK